MANILPSVAQFFAVNAAACGSTVKVRDVAADATYRFKLTGRSRGGLTSLLEHIDAQPDAVKVSESKVVMANGAVELSPYGTVGSRQLAVMTKLAACHADETLQWNGFQGELDALAAAARARAAELRAANPTPAPVVTPETTPATPTPEAVAPETVPAMAAQKPGRKGK